MRSRKGSRHRESGAALLLMMLVIIVGAAAILVTKLDRNAGRSFASVATHSAMSVARSALLDYAISYSDRFPGQALQLPCPDIDAGGTTGDGESHTLNCGGPGESVMGRFPWRSLGIPAPVDGAGECLWYVVSGEFKSAGAATSPMINPDSNGQFQLYESESGSIIAGATADSRPVAMILAPQRAMDGQSRQAVSLPGQQCSNDFSAADFLDNDPGTGVSNSTLSPGVAIDQFVRSIGAEGTTNDHVMMISRAELESLIYGRHDFDSRIRAITHALAACVASYGLSNPGGANDRRLPWPSPVMLGDYRIDSAYDDAAGGVLSGRLADIAGDSNTATGNTIARVLSDCSTVTVPEWNAEMLGTWQNWKDHFFYYVADSFSPASTVPSSCASCISVNGAGQFVAVIVFANRRLPGIGQLRTAPPLDADSKSQIGNYLEGRNVSNHPYAAGTVDLESRVADPVFNDYLYCIDSSLAVSAC